MNSDLDSFEQELRRLKPAEAPLDFSARLLACRPTQSAVAPVRLQVQRRAGRREWIARWWWAWLAPVGAMAMVVAALAWWTYDRGVSKQPQTARKDSPVEVAQSSPEQVEIDHRLVDSYEAVAEVPSSPPVRVRVNEWMDKVVFRDTARGLAIERREPRVEVVPVRYESY